MRNTLPAAILAATLIAAAGAGAAAPEAVTSPAFLTAIDGRQARHWIAAENARTLDVLKRDPRYAGFRARALAIAEAEDRIPAPVLVGDTVTNFWQDRAHVRGIWRRTTLASYLSATPAWTTLIDLDALSAREHANWVWEGADCAPPEDRLCMITLSDGGEDATSLREFDLAADRFVDGGFALPHGKQQVGWEDGHALLVARDWGRGSMTRSGYPFIVKRLLGGAPLAAANEVYRARPDDVGAAGATMVDGNGHRATVITREIDAFSSENLLLGPAGTSAINLPPRATIEGLVAGRLVARIDQDWQPSHAGAIAAGSLVSLPLDHPDGAPTLIFRPGPRQSVEDVSATRGRLVAAIFDNVRGGAYVFTPEPGGGWSARRVGLPDDVSVAVATTSERTDTAFLSVTGFLTPTQLWVLDAAASQAHLAKSTPARFDASADVVEQNEAVSADGTRVPYFLVHRRDMRADGGNPTELYAYGGFQVSMTPRYDATLGSLWLAQGGVYALANIRGGGEFGPAWHEQATKTHRQRTFDDFAAVGRDLIARKITDPRHLGIRGGSNGGLLMGVEFTQAPELWGAAVIEVPLLDMLHYEQMSAGASWVGEYGSVANPAERRFLASVSPLENLRAGVRYPTPFIVTTTKDDRVGPVHARRFAWRMAQLHLPFLYYEETEGGHAAGANLPEVATERALEYTYLARQLMR